MPSAEEKVPKRGDSVRSTEGEPKARSARGRQPLVAVLAIAVIAGAGVVISKQSSKPIGGGPSIPNDSVPNTPPPAVMAPLPPPREAPVDVTAHPADFRTRLFVSHGGKDGASVVSLGKAVGPSKFEAITGTRPRLLERELVRQAVLIAARDELGLQTRDEILDEVSPSAGEGEPIELSSYYGQMRGRIMIRKGEGEKAETLFAKELSAAPDGYSYPGEIAKIAESLSRTQFAEVLKGAGLAGEPNKVRVDAPLPAGVEESMSRLGIVENYAAVRALHDAIGTDGESPERLGALSRAYAQLGALTRYQWSARPRVFNARAMLYAERLVARDPASTWALRNRAFVRALVGLHRLAIDDLTLATLRDERAQAASPPPAWVEMIDAYVKFDMARLKAVKDPYARLAALLTMSAVEHPSKSGLLIEASKDLIKADPDCARAFDVLSLNGPIGVQHQSTLLGLQSFDDHFSFKLKAVKELPADVRKVLDDDEADGPSVIAALDEAGGPSVDVGEPPWGGLAHLARDAYFAAVWRRLSFMKYMWGVPVDEYWGEVRHLVDGHRYQPYLESVADPQNGGPAFNAMAEKFDPSDLEIIQIDLINAMRRLKHPDAESLWGIALEHGALVFQDLCWAIAETSESNVDYKVRNARDLLSVSPYAPYAKSALVQYDWERVKDKVDAWKVETGDAPAFLDGLSAKYMELKQYDEAIDALNRCIKQSPDHWGYMRLAECYEAKGDYDGWILALGRYLNETEDAGLGHATARVKIAKWLMTQGRPIEAKEYAEDAAQTWAAWAMICAAEVNEELKDWEQAELWYRRTSERYPDTSWGYWYRFCLLTGQGDIDEARAFAKSVVEDPDNSSFSLWAVAYFDWSNGEQRKAIAKFEEVYRADRKPLSGLPLMLFTDQIGDTTRRDEVLNDLCTELASEDPAVSEFCQILRDFLAKKDGKETLDLAAVDKIRDSTPDRFRGDIEFFTGMILRNHGQVDEGRKYLQICAEASTSMPWHRGIAASIVRSADKKPEPPARDEKPGQPPKAPDSARVSSPISV